MKNQNEDVYDLPDQYRVPVENDYYECSCGWFGRECVVVKEYGMIFYLCPNCSSELV
jgi:hypothetical protein